MALGVWEFDREADALRAAAIIAMDRLASPDFHIELVSSQGDHVTVQIASGSLTDPDAIIYVEGRGTSEIVRVEPWGDRWVMLVLRAWPNRG
jgi:hypothetical protein